ncbi:hypothetical protein D3C79_1062820 [compost metagenome]
MALKPYEFQTTPCDHLEYVRAHVKQTQSQKFHRQMANFADPLDDQRFSYTDPLFDNFQT